MRENKNKREHTRDGKKEKHTITKRIRRKGTGNKTEEQSGVLFERRNKQDARPNLYFGAIVCSSYLLTNVSNWHVFVIFTPQNKPSAQVFSFLFLPRKLLNTLLMPNRKEQSSHDPSSVFLSVTKS